MGAQGNDAQCREGGKGSVMTAAGVPCYSKGKTAVFTSVLLKRARNYLHPNTNIHLQV